jgi:hypothetical protein
MDIDQQDGTVRLSNGVAISPGLTQLAFRAQPVFENSGTPQTGKPPWVHYRVHGDVTDGKSFHVILCFYGQVLVSVDLCASLYPPGATGWDSYSDGIEAATKDFHDRLLQHLFTRHASAESFHAPQLSEDLAILKRPVNWSFPWGSVVSYHDSRSSTTFITVSYGDRLAQAQAGTLAAPENTAVKSEFVQTAESNPEYAWGFETAKQELARGNRRGAIRLVRETSSMSVPEAEELVAFWGKLP